FRDVKKGKIKPLEKKSKKSSSKLNFATNFQKTKAAITDSFMLLMPIMYIVFYLVMDGREGFAQHKLEGWIYILVPFIIVQSAFMFKGNGQTPGYKNYNLKVVDINTNQTPPLFSIVFRNIAMILSIVTIFGWAMMFIRKDKRGLHDLLSNTAVVSVENES
ncbi:MAG: RDD family protein, partial [Sulfurovaceae bacterium]|nr:RDD family protein [Sulfurovaceae bacterium]